jgi:hypothetical protein
MIGLFAISQRTQMASMQTTVRQLSFHLLAALVRWTSGRPDNQVLQCLGEFSFARITCGKVALGFECSMKKLERIHAAMPRSALYVGYSGIGAN